MAATMVELAGRVDPELRSAAVERVRINFAWLLKLRRAAVLGQLATIAVVGLGLGVRLPVVPLLAIVMAGMSANVALQFWFLLQSERGTPSGWLTGGRRLLGAVLLLDILLLAALLYFTGGAGNPFSIFFFVNLVLSAVVLGGRWLKVVFAAAIVCYAALLLVFRDLPPLGGPTLTYRAPGGPLRLSDLSLYAYGSLAAFVAVASFTGYFVRRLTTELRQRERDLDAERERQADAARLESLGTLAAGAAHELSSPLSTIAVVARELERLLGQTGADETAVEDAKLIRDEVARCRKILDQMSLDAGASVGEELVRVGVGALIEGALSKLRERERVDVELAPSAEVRELLVPRTALVRAVRALIKNGLDASPGPARVRLRVEPMGSGVAIEVRDAGAGMDATTLERASDPFFTTKDPGMGMGLGLFLVRTLAQRLGGRLSLDSTPGLGTTARLELPRDAA